MKLLTRPLLDDLTEKAKASPRHRAHYNLHPVLEDPVQRLCIAMEPDTYVRPHRHADPASWEVLLVLRGSLLFLLFDDAGTVTERVVLTAGGDTAAIEFPEKSWHAPVSLEPGTIVFEVKQGPYRQIAEVNLAAWAPPENTAEAVRCLQWYRTARIGDHRPLF